MNSLEAAHAELAAGNIEESLKLFIQYTEAHPEDPVGYVAVGDVLAKMNELARSERFYLKAIELDGNIATAYYGLGNLYFITEKYDLAEKKFIEAEEKGMKQGDLYFMLGMTFLKKGNELAGIPYFQRAKELNPNDIEAAFQYGLSLAKMHYFGQAKPVFKEILSKAPEHIDSLYNLALIYIHDNAWDKAERNLKLVLSIKPNHHMADDALEIVKRNMNS